MKMKDSDIDQGKTLKKDSGNDKHEDKTHFLFAHMYMCTCIYIHAHTESWGL